LVAAQRLDGYCLARGCSRVHDFPERLAAELRDCYPFQDGYSPAPAGLVEVRPQDCFQARQSGALPRDSPVLPDVLSRHDCLPPERPVLVQLRSAAADRRCLLRPVAVFEPVPAARHALSGLV